MEKVGEHGVRLTFNDKADRELPLLLALLPILPKHATDAENFDKSTLKPLIGVGPLPHRQRQARRGRRPEAQSGLLGEGHPVQARPRQLRRDPDQLLPRRQHHVRGLQEGRHRHPARNRHRPLGERLQLSRPPPTAASSRTPSRAACPPACTASCSTRAATIFKEPRRPAGARRPVRLRMGQQEPVLRRLSAHAQLL